MSRILIAPYKLGSKGAKDLARSIGALRTKATKRLKRDVTLINWGRSDLVPRGRPYRILNQANKVQRATNKLLCLDRLKNASVSAIEHTTNINTVASWLNEPDVVVYGRHLLNASQGRGIVIIKPGDRVPHCPLYTKGISKAHEYRVHVFGNKVLDVTKKRKRNGVEVGGFIKNLANGWVYCRDGIEVPENLLQVAIAAVSALELDFGAVDLLYKRGQPYVLEINTAPGLQGTTLQKYAEEFNKLKNL